MLRDPDVLAVAARTTAEARPHLDAVFPERWPAELEIETVEGRVLRASTQSPKGDPDNRLTPDEARAKFRSLAGAALDEASLDAIEAAVARIESAENVDELVAAVSGAGVR